MLVAVVAIVVALAALAAPYVLPAGSGSTKTTTGSAQTREIWLLSTEWNMDAVPSGLNHYGFTPTQITVNQGDTVLIHFYNTHSDTHHTFTLPAYNLNVDVAPNQNKTFSFTAAQAGVFTFTCSFHATTMRGQLIVIAQ